MNQLLAILIHSSSLLDAEVLIERGTKAGRETHDE
jgi:hypothetical protein